MKTGSLKAKNVAELRDMALELDVVGRHKMSKEALIEAILEARARLAQREKQKAVASSRPLSARSARTGLAAGPKSAALPVVARTKLSQTAARSAKAPAQKTQPPKSAAKSQAKTPGNPPAKPAAKPPAKPPVKAASAKPAEEKRPVDRPAKAASRKTAPENVSGKAARPITTGPATKAAARSPLPAPKPVAPAVKPQAPAKLVEKPAGSAARKKADAPAPAKAPSPVKAAEPKKGRAAGSTLKKTPTPAKTAAAPRVGRGRHNGAIVRPIRRTPVKKPAKTFRLTPAAPPLNMRAGTLAEEQAKLQTAAGALQKEEPVPPTQPHHEQLHTIYVDDRVVLLPRDPQWLYCYWDFSDPTMTALRDSMARFGGEMVLRIHDVTGLAFDGTNSNAFVDVVLPRQAQGNWYFQSFGEDREHIVEIGLRMQDRFQALVRSNAVRTPRSAGAPAPADTRAEMLVGLAQERAAGLGATEPDMEAPSHPSSPLKPIGPHAAPPIPGLGGPQAPLPSSPLGGWAPSSPFGPQAPERPVAPPEVRERQFWLVVDCELIVYGATVPGSALEIQGRPMQLRPDGTFSVRYALPDGRQVIPVAATSADGVDRLEITPIVERWTKTGEQEP